MQSGQAKAGQWVLEFIPSEEKVSDPLMGWTGSADTQTQVTLRFENKAAAMSYARKHGIVFRVDDPKIRKHIIRPGGYGDNFASGRRQAWSH